MKKLLALIPISLCAGELILEPVQDSSAIMYHLYFSVGTNEFQHIMTVETNKVFHLTNDFVGMVRFYITSEDSSGNVSEPSNIITNGTALHKPILKQITNEWGHMSVTNNRIYEVITNDTPVRAWNGAMYSTREILQRKHNNRMATLALPPPPLPPSIISRQRSFELATPKQPPISKLTPSEWTNSLTPLEIP